ncbi:MAG: Cyanophycin synthetase [candidate division WS6 bacterium GW2011_GWF2_39_15]|uniref:Cyanophycin synthetase n=1 Tax=candidate division WS6 bacterium GW2011_GWF2_39_15 TaxID=1619100 RepID=A0A0G0MT99_9BACT|nr:MAG: Cyanophycin synthetase [candidate division WS6 bacterium GW2011_GWF2_39_15]
MNVQVLQGINLENTITTIKITTDKTPRTELVDLVKDLHPVFMEEYSIEGNTISIQSKLPHFWKETAVALNNFSSNEWSFDLAKSYILGTVIKKQILSMSTIPILHAAHELGYETTQYFIEQGFTPENAASKFNRYYGIGIGQESEVTASIASSRDSHLAMMTQSDKWLTNIMLDRLKLPIAQWELINSEGHLKELHEKYRKPYVIKPVGLTGGNGVTTNINTFDQAQAAYETATKAINSRERAEFQKKIMIQQTVQGEDYRLLVIAGRLEIVTKRIPAFVTGDGAQTIEKLIAEINKDPRRDLANPTHILKPIIIDDQLTTYLKEQGLDINYVPKKDEKIYVRKVASMSQGGITEDFTDRVSNQIRYVVESLASSLHAYALGVDVICKDISKPLTQENGSIIECNTMPESYLNAFPVIGDQYPQIGKIVVKGLVGNKPFTKKIVYIGKDIKKLHAFLKTQTDASEKTGILSNGSIYINEEEINANLETWKALEAMKLNASLSTIAIHYESIDEVRESGLGFDRIDAILIDNKYESEDWTSKLEGYKNLGLINTIKTV